MQIPSTVSIWLSEQAMPLALIAASMISILAVLSYSASRRVARLRVTRSGLNEDTFIESLLPYNFDPQICRTVYRYLQGAQNIRFPIEAGDHLDEDLGLGLIDLDETIRETFERSNRRFQPGLRHRPLITVEDLVRLIQASPRTNARAA